MKILTLTVLLIAPVAMLGCGGAADEGGESQATAEHGHDEHGHEDGHDEHADGHTDGGWWCSPHGVPEDECALCKSSLVASFKEKGDWCEEHERPESQCFLCDASRFDKFAARYEAKYGKQPPQPEEIAEKE